MARSDVLNAIFSNFDHYLANEVKLFRSALPIVSVAKDCLSKDVGRADSLDEEEVTPKS